MSWHEEMVTIELVDEKGEKIGDIEITKKEFVTIGHLAAKEGITVNEMFVKLLEQEMEDE